jgi:hypothetical protein
MKIGTMAGERMYRLKSLEDSLLQRKADRIRRTKRHTPQKIKTLAFLTCEDVPCQIVSSAMAQFVASPA